MMYFKSWGLLLGALLFCLVANGQSLCWEISGKGLKKPSYIYGTMHLSDQRIIDVAKNKLPYLNKCEVYAMELDPDKMDMQKIYEALMSPSSQSIQASLTVEEYNTLDSILKQKIGISAQKLDNVSPFILATLLSTPIGMDETESKAPILDMYFYNQAKKQKIKAIGIETLDEQLDVFSKLRFEEQINLLKKALVEENTSKMEFDKMMDFYLVGAIDSLLSFSNDSSLPKAFEDALLNTRNEKMANRIAAFVTSKSHFIAIGALHLSGELGVLNLLRKEGFELRPVNQGK